VQARVDRTAVLPPQQRNREDRDDTRGDEPDADGRPFDDEAGRSDQWGDQEVVQHHASGEPEQQFDRDLGEQEPGAPRAQRHARRTECVSHRTSSDVTHFVCNTPGRFGAMIRHG
jgi:hypothetical protein